MNRNIFCSRKKGVTIKGKFYPRVTVTDILAAQVEGQANKIEFRRRKAESKVRMGPFRFA